VSDKTESTVYVTPLKEIVLVASTSAKNVESVPVTMSEPLVTEIVPFPF
jgi:hypothetical protein